jgi:hypothetical protein
MISYALSALKKSLLIILYNVAIARPLLTFLIWEKAKSRLSFMLENVLDVPVMRKTKNAFRYSIIQML